MTNASERRRPVASAKQRLAICRRELLAGTTYFAQVPGLSSRPLFPITVDGDPMMSICQPPGHSDRGPSSPATKAERLKRMSNASFLPTPRRLAENTRAAPYSLIAGPPVRIDDGRQSEGDAAGTILTAWTHWTRVAGRNALTDEGHEVVAVERSSPRDAPTEFPTGYMQDELRHRRRHELSLRPGPFTLGFRNKINQTASPSRRRRARHPVATNLTTRRSLRYSPTCVTVGVPPPLPWRLPTRRECAPIRRCNRTGRQAAVVFTLA